MSKDLSQMNKIVRSKVIESKKATGDRSIPLKEGIQVIFIRPNEDGMIEKIISPLKNELEDMEKWEEVTKSLVEEAIGAIKNPDAFQPVVLTSYVIFLENFIAEFKPRIPDDKLARELITMIQDAKLKIPEKSFNERKLTMMKTYPNPSDLASEALKEALAKLPPTTAPVLYSNSNEKTDKK